MYTSAPFMVAKYRDREIKASARGTITATSPHVKAGSLRGIAVTTTTRSGMFPDIPTIAESGLAGYDAATWGGILAPAGTPKEIVAKLNASINVALKMDDVRAKLQGAGIEIQGGDA